MGGGSQSTDATVGIAAAAGARVAQFAFNGSWPKKRNWALESLAFAHEWGLLLDADAEIREVMERAGWPDGYWINRRFNFLGTWLRHAYCPNWNLRLFRHRLGRFE